MQAELGRLIDQLIEELMAGEINLNDVIYPYMMALVDSRVCTNEKECFRDVLDQVLNAFWEFVSVWGEAENVKPKKIVLTAKYTLETEMGEINDYVSVERKRVTGV